MLCSAFFFVEICYKTHSATQRVSRNQGCPLPNFKYDTLEEVCVNRKWFDSPLQKWGLKKSLMLTVEGPYHSSAYFEQPPLAAARWLCIHVIFTSFNKKISLWSNEEISFNFAVYQKRFLLLFCLSYHGNVYFYSIANQIIYWLLLISNFLQ